MTDAIFKSATGARCIGYNQNPLVDLVINDVNSDGVIEWRLEGDPENFFAGYYNVASGFGYLEIWKKSGNVSMDFSPKPNDGVSQSIVDVFRNTNTTGECEFRVHSGNYNVSPVFKVAGKTGRTSIGKILNMAVTTAPQSPLDGDVWREDNTNTGLKIRLNGVTKTIVIQD